MKRSILKGILVVAVAAAVTAEPQIISSILAASGLSAPLALVKVASDTKTMKEGLDFAGNVTRFATSFVANTSDHISNVTKAGLNATAVIGKEAIEGGAKLTKQGLGLAKSIAKYVPGYSSVITVGANVGLTGLPIVESAAKTGLNIMTKGSEKAVTLGNQIVKKGAGAVDSVAQTGIGIGKSAVNGVEKVKNTLSRFTGGQLFRASTRSLTPKKTNHDN
ncbi:hypothetical protein GE061_019312 [Apolygus lucorum]|uniref:Uncharacterized protein n=1 Tax=Apolygus lucorum TaxID=248454 RepID=A0A6A4JW53_APOLU|nr:hypothetical protein GE061_019312 [Apolygus lucorum]